MDYLWTDSLEFTSHLGKETYAMADSAIEGNIIFTDHYEMEKCRTPYSMKQGIPWDTTQNGDGEWCFALARHTIIRALASVYAARKDKKAKEQCLSMWNDFLTKAPHTKEREKTCWRSLEAGIRVEQWLRTLEILCLAGVTIPEATAKQIDQSLDEHASFLLATHDAFHRLSNWGVIQDHGLFLLGVWKNNQSWIDTALTRLEEELSLQVLPDGVDWEQSPLYHAEVLRCALDVISVGRHRGIKCPKSIEENTKKMAEALPLMTYGEGMLFPQGDSDLVCVSDLFTKASLLFHEESLFRGLQEETYQDFHSDELKELPYQQQPKKSTIGEGTCCFHQGPYTVGFHATAIGSGHGHLDAGNVDVAFNDQLILGDGGRATYMDTPVRQQLKNPEAHNVLTLEHDAKSDESWSYTSLLQVVSMRAKQTEDCDVAECWIRHPDETLTRRRVLTFPFGVIVFDDLYGQAKATIAWHAMPNVAVEQDKERYGVGPLSLKILGCDTVTKEKDIRSTEYNSTSESMTIKGTMGKQRHIVTIITDTQVEAKEHTLSFVGDTKRILTEEEGYGITIMMGGHKVNVINRRKECIHQVDLVKCDSLEGYGSLLFSVDEKAQTVWTW